MFSILLCLTAIAGYAFLSVRFLRLPVPLAPLFAACGMILVTYVAGLLGLMGIFAWLVVVTGVVAMPAVYGFNRFLKRGATEGGPSTDKFARPVTGSALALKLARGWGPIVFFVLVLLS